MEKIVQTAGRNALGEFSPEFAHFNDDVLFGENWNNQDIDVKTRSIITVVALMASGITDSSLRYHLQNAKPSFGAPIGNTISFACARIASSSYGKSPSPVSHTSFARLKTAHAFGHPA